MECMIASGILAASQLLFVGWMKWQGKAYMETIFENAAPGITGEIDAFVAEWNATHEFPFEEMPVKSQQAEMGKWLWEVWQGGN